MNYNRDEIKAALAWAEKKGLAIPPTKNTLEELSFRRVATDEEFFSRGDDDDDECYYGKPSDGYGLFCSLFRSNSFWRPTKGQDADLDPETRAMEYWSEWFCGHGSVDGDMPSSRM